MAERGIDLEKLYFDVPRMRSAYPSHFLSSGIAYAFHPHRDTWYSAPMCQLNWWLPIYPVDPNNGMGFYPRNFTDPVANNSEIYNYYEWNTKNRASAAQHVKSDTREQPKPQEPVEGVNLRYVPPPGGIILFSGAQLHETVANTTDLARYSIDFRTVHLDDVAGKVGALNIDSKSTGTTMRDYLRATDLAKLPEELIALYDDGSAEGDKVLYFGDRLAKGD
jgi:ectoine hydroxylase-related dioxygenase (phytanoyl-CoA dioxygenase family)